MRRDGQAIVEFVVALVVILVLVAGIIQIAWMGHRHSLAMGEARREAGVKAMMDLSSFESPRYIQSCTPGPDGIEYSRDDDASAGDRSGLNGGILEYAHPDDLGSVAPGNRVSVMADSEMPEVMFGLVKGEKREAVELMPIVRQLLYRDDAVEVRGLAWLTWTKGIY